MPSARGGNTPPLIPTRFDFSIHVVEIRPWIPMPTPLVIMWQRGDKRAGLSHILYSVPDEEMVSSNSFRIPVNESFKVPATLYKDPSMGASRTYQRKSVVFTLFEASSDHTNVPKGDPLARALLDLAEYGDVPGLNSLSVKVSLGPRLTSLAQSSPQLTLSICFTGKKRPPGMPHMPDRDGGDLYGLSRGGGRPPSSFSLSDFTGGVPPYREGSVVDPEEDASTEYSFSHTEEDSHWESTASRLSVSRSMPQSRDASPRPRVPLREEEVFESEQVVDSFTRSNTESFLSQRYPTAARRSSWAYHHQRSFNDTLSVIDNRSRASPPIGPYTVNMSAPGRTYHSMEESLGYAAMHEDSRGRHMDRGRAEQEMILQVQLEVARERKRLEELNREVAQALADAASAQEKAREAERHSVGLPGALRDAAIMEHGIYSVPSSHGLSEHRLLTSARRLWRALAYSREHESAGQFQALSRQVVSSLLLALHSCGDDVSRLVFWWSNIVVLRESLDVPVQQQKKQHRRGGSRKKEEECADCERMKSSESNDCDNVPQKGQEGRESERMPLSGSDPSLHDLDDQFSARVYPEDGFSALGEGEKGIRDRGRHTSPLSDSADDDGCSVSPAPSDAVCQPTTGGKEGSVEGEEEGAAWRTQSPARAADSDSCLPPAEPSEEDRSAALTESGRFEEGSMARELFQLEEWVHSKILHVLWTQLFLPLLKLPEGDEGDRAPTKGGKVVKARSQRRDVVSGVNRWVAAFQDVVYRLCPARAHGSLCACLMPLSKQILEQCMARLDVAIFNAMLRSPEETTPTDLVSDPISDPNALLFPPGPLTFNHGLQLKIAVSAWNDVAQRYVASEHRRIVYEPVLAASVAPSPIWDVISHQQHPSSQSICSDISQLDPVSQEEPFPYLRALGDLLMVPKAMLSDHSVRKEVCQVLSLPLIRRVIYLFKPDGPDSDYVSPALIAAINAEVQSQAQSKAGKASDSVKAPAAHVVYRRPFSDQVRDILISSAARCKTALEKGGDSDQELSSVESPWHLLSENFSCGASSSHPAGDATNVGKVKVTRKQKSMGYKLLREMMEY